MRISTWRGHKVVSVSVLIAVVLLVGLARVVAGQQLGVIPLRQVTFGTWMYSAARMSNGGIEAYVQYRHATASDLRAYADANKQLAQRLAKQSGPATVQVTFRAPLSPATFRTWATNAGFTVQIASLRTVEASGRRSLLVVAPQGSDPLPQAALDRQLASVPESVKPLTLQGVFAARGTVSAVQLPAIAADPAVFVTDVTPTFVPQDLAAAGIRDAQKADVSVEPAFWWMEQLGLSNF